MCGFAFCRAVMAPLALLCVYSAKVFEHVDCCLLCLVHLVLGGPQDSQSHPGFIACGPRVVGCPFSSELSGGISAILHFHCSA